MTTFEITVSTDHPDANSLVEDALGELAKALEYEGYYNAKITAFTGGNCIAAYDITPYAEGK